MSEKASKKSTEFPRGNGETVLIVEDDPDVRDVTAATLRSLGYAVIEAENGQQGLAALKAAPEIKILLSDVVMPGGMNGAQLRLEALKIWPNLGCILMSGYSDLPDGAVPDGVILLSKPVSRKKFANALSAALNRQSP